MTNKQIDKFILKFGGKNINFYINSDRKQQCASAYFYNKNRKTKRNVYLIDLQKRYFHNKKYSKYYLESMLLHEIGHVKRKHFHKKIDEAKAEYEAHAWALKKAVKYNLNKVTYFLVLILFNWGEYKKYKSKRKLIYYKAYKMFCKKLGKKGMKDLEDMIK